MRHRHYLFLILFVHACSQGSTQPSTTFTFPPGGTRVLFVGNSLTYANDLPRIVERLAAIGGDTIRTASVALPNHALIDHVTGEFGSRARSVIQGNRWDYVVLQQGPTTSRICTDTLVIAVRALDEMAKLAGARTAVMSVWPIGGSLIGFDRTLYSHRYAAEQVSARLFPAGVAWREAWAEDASLGFYGPDAYHPSELGSFLAALVIYEGITGRDVTTLPARVLLANGELSMTESRIRLLQRAAHRAVQQFNPAAVPLPGFPGPLADHTSC